MSKGDPSNSNKQHGGTAKWVITIFLTTHNMYEASKLCDNIALLNQGEIIEYGNPKDICRKHNIQEQFTIVLQNDETIVLPNTPESGEKIGNLIKNKNIKSKGSLMAVRNRTMESAPTIPSDTTMLDCIVRISEAVVIATPAMAIPKFLE